VPLAFDSVADAMIEAFSSRKIDLYANSALLADLGRLRLKESPAGWRLDAPRTAAGHRDRATALENPFLFYPRRVWEFFSKYAALAVYYLWLECLRRRIERDGDAAVYTDAALSAPCSKPVRLPPTRFGRSVNAVRVMRERRHAMSRSSES
jgi:hypothetical protein